MAIFFPAFAPSRAHSCKVLEQGRSGFVAVAVKCSPTGWSEGRMAWCGYLLFLDVELEWQWSFHVRWTCSQNFSNESGKPQRHGKAIRVHA
jgi:hypothetical protein